MSLFKFILSMQISLFITGQIFAQDLLTLEEAIAISLKKNHQIQVSRNTAKISANNAHVGNANFLPQLNLTSGVNYSDATSQTSMGPVEQQITVTSAQLEASYNLFAGLGDYYSFRKLKSQSKSAALSTKQTIANTIIQVANAYYAAASAADGLQIARESVVISLERLERMRKRSDFGQANQLDILNAEVDLNADSVSFLNAKQSFKESVRNLTLLLGLEGSSIITVENTVRFSSLSSFDILLERALQKNHTYRLAQSNLKTAQYDMNKSWSMHLPRLDLRGSYGYNQYAPDLEVKWDDPNKNLSAGLALSLNLFDGFKRSTQTQNARISLRNQELLADQARLNLEKEVRNAYSTWQNKRAIYEMNKKSLSSAELNFKRTQELHELGRLTNTQFREAQLNLVRSRFNLSQTKYQAKLAEITLANLSGDLFEEK